MDDRQDVIISAITAYSFEALSIFLSSALRNTRADIILMADRLTSDLRGRLLASPRVRLIQAGIDHKPRSMLVRRFGIALEILNRGQWRQVLLCDSRDVFLQDGPVPLQP